MTYDFCYCDSIDAPSLYRVNDVRRARKRFWCVECHAPIRAGQPYRRHFGVWDGDAATMRECMLCAEMGEWARISVPCTCWVFGEMHETIRSMVREVAPDVPGFAREWGWRAAAVKRAGGRTGPRCIPAVRSVAA